MSLHSLLGLHSSIGDLSLPQYMNALQRGEIKPPVEREGLAGFMPAPPARRAPPKPDPTETAFAQYREEQRQQDIYDRHAMAETIRRKRDAAAAGNYSNDPIRNAEQRFHQTRKWDHLATQLNNGDDYAE